MADKKLTDILKEDVLFWNKWRKSYPSSKPDLRNADLSGFELHSVDLSNADLSDAILIKAILNKANLRNANLSNADFGEADLCEADLSEANLYKANLTRTNLSSSILRKADLTLACLNGTNLVKTDFSSAIINEVQFSNVDLENVNLKNAILSKANFRKTKLIKVNFSEEDLSNSNFIEADLSEANLKNTNLSNTKFNKAYLKKTILFGANFSNADLSGADLSGADLRTAIFKDTNISQAIIDQDTDLRKVEGCQVGVNGLYCIDSDSAALMTLTPPGNSMQGSNPAAVIESLIRARRLQGFSMSLTGLVLLFATLGLDTIPYQSIDIPAVKFGLLAMPLSIGILSLVTSFMSDALKGARYLRDRNAAMSVGNFPWVLSKYASSSLANRLQSVIIRFFMAFHPLIYLYYWNKYASWTSWTNWTSWEKINMIFYLAFIVLLLFLSLWTFILSQQFQKPILFDTKTEIERHDDLTKLTMAVENQTTVISDLCDYLKQREDITS